MKIAQLTLAWLALPGFLAANAADFPAPFNTQQGEPMPAKDALATIKTPPGFHVSLFAAEPDVQQPIAMATDARGRLWVAENYTYAEAKTGFDLSLRDRIIILEDTDHDGHFDKRTVFWDQGQRVSSVEVGFGGVWVLAPPQLLFIPDKNGDDVPDGKPVVLLDGFDADKVRHNMANGLRWGPDGWLYGRHGIQATSAVGAPGTPAEKRTKMNCGIWRYHPTRKIFEVVASGTTNPWGMDWDENGEAFFVNTVIGHLWHLIPGAHYQRMYGEDLTPHTYGLIEQTADHLHWTATGKWTESRDGKNGADELGGGHAHEGCLIYQGGAWPEQYLGKLFTINFWGRRVNMENLERSGSGYVAKHGADFLTVGDPWFRGIDLLAAADGGVFMSDWSDTGECHENDGVHRTSGRIYKIDFGTPAPPANADLAKLGSAELAKMQLEKNEWLARQSRRLLQERAAAGGKMKDAQTALLASFTKETDVPHRLRALWALHAIGATPDPWLRKQLQNTDEHIRVWAIRFLTEDTRALKTVPADFLRLAEKDASPMVRLALASALQRFPAEARADLARPLLQHAEDAADHNLPLMLWYGLIPLGDSDPGQLATLGGKAKIPLTARCIAHRLAERIHDEPLAVDVLLGGALGAGPEIQAAIIDGLADGLKGAKSAPMPLSWEQLTSKLAEHPDAKVRERVHDLDAIFTTGRAVNDALRTLLDPKMAPELRADALQTLIEIKPPELKLACENMLGTPALFAPAIRALADFDDPLDAAIIIAKYKTLAPPARADAMDALASRPHFAAALLDAITAARIPRAALDPAHSEKIRALNDEALTKKLDALPAESAKPDAPAKKRAKPAAR